MPRDQVIAKVFFSPMLLFASLLLIAGTMSSHANDTSTVPLKFNGQSYVSRWSQAGQYEFTPPDQRNLSDWRDMVTIDVHDKVGNGEQLAQLANAVLGRYKKAGRVLATDSTPRTMHAPAEHFVSAVLGQRGYLEAIFARFVLRHGKGMVIVYSHRIYGKSAGDSMSRWLEKHGPAMQSRLMGWDAIPSPEALQALTH